VKILLTQIIILLSFVSLGQELSPADSIKQKIDRSDNASVQIELLVELGYYYSENEIDSLFGYAHKLINLARSEDQPCNEAIGYHYKGNYFSAKGEYDDALSFYKKSMTLRERHCDIEKVASSAAQIGNVNARIGNYDEAYLSYYQAIGIYEDLGDEESLAAQYSNLGLVDVDRGKYRDAEESFTKSLNYLEGSKDSVQLGHTYNNFGNLYQTEEKYDTAVVYFQKALQIYRSINYTSGLAHGLNNIGIIYYYQGQEDSCMNYFKRSLAIRKEIGEIASIAQSYNNIGILYGYQAKYKMAVIYSDSSLALAKESGLKEEIRDAYSNLYDVYWAQKNYENAAISIKFFSDYQDSLKSEQSERLINDAKIKYETIKTDKELQENQALIDQNNAELKRKEIIIWAACIGGLLLVSLLLVVYNRNKLTKRQNKVIEDQKSEVEQKQTEIIDSIKYAKLIQDAMLKSEDEQSEHLPENFVLYMPKDIVSGDFYWVHEDEEILYLAVGDCTGHGVPGGFLTMLGSSMLNEIVSGEKKPEPAFILDKLRSKIVAELSQTGNIGENRDGMDLSLVKMNLKTYEVSWAGANNPIWIIPGNNRELAFVDPKYKYRELNEIKPNKQPIAHHHIMTPFTNHKFKLEKGDLFYLFSDGYADQFGGEKGKKFKYKSLMNLMIETKAQPLSEVKERMNQVFQDWKGELEQIDDVCIMGVRV
jgi:tetratricopeptide (TPR) repeat protein